MTELLSTPENYSVSANLPSNFILVRLISTFKFSPLMDPLKVLLIKLIELISATTEILMFSSWQFSITRYMRQTVVPELEAILAFMIRFENTLPAAKIGVANSLLLTLMQRSL